MAGGDSLRGGMRGDDGGGERADCHGKGAGGYDFASGGGQRDGVGAGVAGSGGVVDGVGVVGRAWQGKLSRYHWREAGVKFVALAVSVKPPPTGTLALAGAVLAPEPVTVALMPAVPLVAVGWVEFLPAVLPAWLVMRVATAVASNGEVSPAGCMRCE